MQMKTGKDLARPAVNAMPVKSYANAKAPAILMQELGLDELVIMNNNENPLGSSPMAIQALRDAAEEINRYPDSKNTEICAKLAEKYNVQPENILCANGADYLIAAMARAFLNPGEKMIIGLPAYAYYETQAQLMGAEVVKIPVNERYTFDLPAMLSAIDEQTKMLVIINPHNPTGVTISKEELADFMAKVPDSCLVVVDEAYIDFADPAVFPDVCEYIRQERNVLALRTFSKFMGMAGLRFGYIVAPEHIIAVLRKVVEAYSVNRLTQVACLAALNDEEFAAASRAAAEEAKSYLRGELMAIGCEVPESQGNFLFVDVGMDADELYEKLLRKGFLVFPCAAWGYPHHIRLSFAMPEQNRRFIATLKEVLGR